LASKKFYLYPASEYLSKISASISKDNFILCFKKLAENNFNFSRSDEKYLLQLLESVVQLNLLHELMSYFSIVQYYNIYNIKLLRALIDIEKYDTAKDACLIIINENSFYKYNKPYIEILSEIYTLQGDIKSKIKILKMYFEMEPTYKTYKELYNLLKDDTEKSEFQKLALSKVIRQNSNDYEYILDLKFGIWTEQKEWIKILNKLESYTAFKTANPILGDLYNYNKSLLLERLLKHVIREWSIYSNKNDIENIKNFIVLNYTMNEINDFEKKQMYITYSIKDILYNIKQRLK
jgi:hypothetical protein